MNVVQSSPSFTKSQRLHCSTVPGCVGPGTPPVLVGVGLDDTGIGVDGSGSGSGSGSSNASTRYDLPDRKLPHSAVMDGFFSPPC